MTYNLLKKVAINQFALHGYEGASLALIAEEVGIKKQSIYTYFKSKEEMFIHTFREAVQSEVDFARSFMEKSEQHSVETLLQHFIEQLLDRYEKNDATKFFVRTVFFPPVLFKELVEKESVVYVTRMEELMFSVFEKNTDLLQTNITLQTASLGYLTFLDGLLVELLYGTPEGVHKRKEATWQIFWQGIARKG